MSRDRPGPADQPDQPTPPDQPAVHEAPRTMRFSDGSRRTWDQLELAPDKSSAWQRPGIAEHPDRPDVEGIRLPPDRLAHILDGDAYGDGGGHLHGTGLPGKAEFPADWDEHRIASAVLHAANQPQDAHHQEHGTWLIRRNVDQVDIWVVVQPDGRVWTAYPDPDSPGVTTNPLP